MARQKLGCCYYPEHWPEDRWAKDAGMMREIGLELVRIGEFSWSRLEPRPGAYSFDWLKRAIDILHDSGLEVVLGTPTAAPPRWLVNRMPDMVPVDSSGVPRKFGSRRHYCFSHEGYRRECERIVTELATAFGTHPGVAAWQTDNEYGCHDTVESYSNAARDAFRRWCAKKYGDIDSLNKAWGNVFWSMELSSFDEIELPNLTVTEANPSHRLDFRRFSSDQVATFNRLQTEIIKHHSPGRTILHNFMGSFTAFDHYALSEDLDAAAWDSYPLGFLEQSRREESWKTRYARVGDPDFQSFHHDLYRACGRGRFWIMEQQTGAVNWAAWNPLPAQGAARLWTFEAFAAGAEAVTFFPWRQVPFAQEQMHEALLLPNGEPNEAYHHAADIARELVGIKAHVETQRATIALVFDYESAWAWDIEPQGRDFSYFDLVLDFYRGLRRVGCSVDIVAPTANAVADRKLVLLPGLFAPRGDFIEVLATCGAVVLMGPRSGSKTRDFQIPPDLSPGSLRRLVDVRVQRVESLRPGVSIPVVGSNGHFQEWREIASTGKDTEAMLKSADGMVGLARLKNNFYLAGRPDETLLDDVLRILLATAGLDPIDLPEDIRIRDNGTLRYVFNYGKVAQDISELIGGATLLLGEKILKPCGVAAFRRDIPHS